MFGFGKKKELSFPTWLVTYQELDFRPAHAAVAKQVFVVLDCETTGLEKKDRIITLGAVKCTAREIIPSQALDQKYTLNQSGKAAEIHGELAENSQASEQQLIAELIAFLKNHIIVGHNISFDIGKINQRLTHAFDVTLKNRVLDTAQLAIRMDAEKYARQVGGKSNLHLDDLCDSYGIPIENRHTALGDAYLTALLFQRLLSGLRKRGIQTVRDLLRK